MEEAAISTSPTCKRATQVAFVATTLLLAPGLASARSVAGGGLSFGTEIGQAGLHASFYEELGASGWRVGGQGTFFFPNDERDDTGFDFSSVLATADLNLQYTFFSRDPAYLYATAGLHFDYVRTRFEFDDPERASFVDDDFGFGASFGLGLDVDIGFSGLFVEAAYVATGSDFSQAVAHSGLRFWF